MNIKGKVVDAHTHAGIYIKSLFDDKYPASGDVINLTYRMKQAGVDCSIVFPFPDAYITEDESTYGRTMSLLGTIPYKLQNERLINEITNLGLSQLLPFLMFSINYAIQEQIDFIENYARTRKIYGLKYYPDADQRTIQDLLVKGRAFLELLEHYNMPIVIHCSESAALNKCGFSNPMEAIMLAEEYPLLRICIAHMAHFSEEFIMTIKEKHLTNIYLDTSPILHLCNIRVLNGKQRSLDLKYDEPVDVITEVCKIFPNNIVWGSDYPFTFTCNLTNPKHNKNYAPFDYDDYYSVFYQLPESLRIRIASENTCKLLFGE